MSNMDHYTKFIAKQVSEGAVQVDEGQGRNSGGTTAGGGYYAHTGSARGAKKFKTLASAKAHAEKHGGKVSSEEAFHSMLQKEEAEQIDEISNKTLRSYSLKSITDRDVAQGNVRYDRRIDPEYRSKAIKDRIKTDLHRIKKRKAGEELADRKLNPNSKVKVHAKEEVEQVNEVSTDTLKKYILKAKSDPKRKSGVNTAINKELGAGKTKVWADGRINPAQTPHGKEIRKKLGLGEEHLEDNNIQEGNKMSSIDKYTQFIAEQARKENGYIEERLSYKPVESDSGEKKPADPARLGHGLDRSSVKHTRVYKGGEHVATIRTHTSHGAYTTHRIIHPDEESDSGFGPKSRELTKHVEKHTGGSESIRAYKQGLNKHFA